MFISELFYSIQGEGKRAGFPSFFIRTNYCNLRCKFKSGNLCDSAYTSWEPKDENNIGEMPVTELINVYSQYKSADIVITGGEPTSQTEDLMTLCKKIKYIDNKIHITLETNGTNSGEYLKYIDLASISPKLKSSIPYSTEFEEMHSKKRIDIQSLISYQKYFLEGILDIQWKFVFTDKSDIDEIIDLQDKIGFSNRNVFLMPEGITKEEIESKRMEIINLCLKYHFNYSDRLHILLYGNERAR